MRFFHTVTQKVDRMNDSGNSLSKRILVAEDDPITQILMILQLQRLGFEADLANNGREAVTAATTRAYDLVLMDCLMPEMDGFEATTMIRQHEAGTGVHVPIVGFTASVLDNALEKCIAAGMDDVLFKSGSIEALRTMIERWLGPASTG